MIRPFVYSFLFIICLITLTVYLIMRDPAQINAAKCKPFDPIRVEIGNLNLNINFPTRKGVTIFPKYGSPKLKQDWVRVDGERYYVYCKMKGLDVISARGFTFSSPHKRLYNDKSASFPRGLIVLIIKEQIPKHSISPYQLKIEDLEDVEEQANGWKILSTKSLIPDRSNSYSHEYLLAKNKRIIRSSCMGDENLEVDSSCRITEEFPENAIQISTKVDAGTHNSHDEPINENNWPYVSYPPQTWPKLMDQLHKFILSKQ